LFLRSNPAQQLEQDGCLNFFLLTHTTTLLHFCEFGTDCHGVISHARVTFSFWRLREPTVLLFSNMFILSSMKRGVPSLMHDFLWGKGICPRHLLGSDVWSGKEKSEMVPGRRDFGMIIRIFSFCPAVMGANRSAWVEKVDYFSHVGCFCL
jgi:hypothetical protein